jgi:hypothetical protein
MDEKKKLIVLLALVAVIACVGVFQLMGHSAPPPKPPVPAPAPIVAQAAPDPTGKPGATSTKDAIKNPEVSNELPLRDPFNAPADTKARVPVVAAPKVERPVPFSRLNSSANSFRPLSPVGKIGELSPLPTTMSGASTRPSAVEDKPFGYKVVGSISGDRPAVVLEDASGNQKLVPVGSAVDGESRVTSVENGAVTIKYRGKKLRLTVGGISVGKK